VARKIKKERKVDDMNPDDHVTHFDVLGDQISPKRVRHFWRKLFGNEPMPEILALLVSEEEAQKIKNMMDEHHKILTGTDNWTDLCEEWEWGKDKGVGTAAMMKLKDNYFLIVIKKTSPYQLKDDLKHELCHVHNYGKENQELTAWVANKRKEG
jgi:hypothetical protein